MYVDLYIHLIIIEFSLLTTIPFRMASLFTPVWRFDWFRSIFVFIMPTFTEPKLALIIQSDQFVIRVKHGKWRLNKTKKWHTVINTANGLFISQFIALWSGYFSQKGMFSPFVFTYPRQKNISSKFKGTLLRSLRRFYLILRINEEIGRKLYITNFRFIFPLVKQIVISNEQIWHHPQCETTNDLAHGWFLHLKVV